MSSGHKYRHQLSAYLMITPSYFVFIFFMFIPMFLTIFYSFTNYDFYKTMDFIGFHNYIRLVQDPIFLRALKNTFVYSAATIVPHIVLGLIFAILLNGKVIGQKFHRVAIYIPYLSSMVVVSMIWLWMFDPAFGMMNQFMKLVGLTPQKWIYDPKLALFSIIIMSIWKFIGYDMIVFLAALQQIPGELYEAATIDGASSLQKVFRITIPLLTPTTFFLFVIACIQSFNVFEQVNIMTNGGPLYATTTVVHQVYRRAFREFEMGYAASMSVVLLIITMILTFINFRYSNKKTDVGLS